MTSRLTPIQKLLRIPGLLRAQIVFSFAQAGLRVHVGGKLRVQNQGDLRVANRAFFLDGIVPIELVCARGAELIIGESTGFNYGTSVRASRSVRIGSRCLIASMVRIRDDDGFVVAPVRIGDDVWIAHGALIEPGVSIGDRAVVSAGSVVTCDVPAGMMALGNPARVMPLKLTTSSEGTARDRRPPAQTERPALQSP
jgi:acetyltransferase-like isoleucine patch superfamily enzyme